MSRFLSLTGSGLVFPDKIAKGVDARTVGIHLNFFDCVWRQEASLVFRCFFSVRAINTRVQLSTFG